jgi:hypothetical protein
VNICVPACQSRRGHTLRRQAETELISPFSWALEMVSRIRRCQSPQSVAKSPQEGPFQGIVVLLGAGVLQPCGPRLACLAAEAKLKQAAKTLASEASFHGVGCGLLLSRETFPLPADRAAGSVLYTLFPSFQIPDSLCPDSVATAICSIISNATAKTWASEDVHWSSRP